MGDASGAGFGSAFWDEKGLHYQAGLHSPDLTLESSNFREADNLVSHLEELDKGGLSDETKVFIITNNLPFEATFYKGHSSSKKLNHVILCLQLLQLRCSCILHVIHIAGT
jgi:hypothetical protein